MIGYQRSKMNIIIEDKVLNYILEKKYEGLLLKTRNQSFG